MADLERLSPEQRKVVETWGHGMAVMAGAGSGKTTTLVIKCAELLKRKPDARFAAVSFTEKSASDLRAKLAENIALDRQWVMTIHGLCGAILREYPREAGYDGEESMLSEGEAQILWARAIEQVWADDALPEIQTALERLLERENRTALWALLRRTRDLHGLGVLSSLRNQTDEDSTALAVLAEFVLERYDRLKRRRGALDFNDLEQGADRALENPVVREAYQNRFDLILVDEFQDTNPVQARIILRLVRKDLSNLCVVGDPKQSIYRFRDADVTVFEEFCSKLPVHISLTWNFRSRPGILEITNRICKKAFEASEMNYEPLIPKREVTQDSAVLKLDLQNPQELARWIRSEMASGIPLQDMALLLRKIRGNERWLKALTSAGIPIAVGSGGLFWEDPRARELVAFLKWWENPSNTLSGAVFLRAPWVSIADTELDQWNKQDPTWVAPFFSSRHPIAEVLSKFRERIVRPGELLMSLLVDEKVEAELGSALLGLWHRAEELSSRGLDFHSVVTEISLSVEERRRERDVPPPRNQGQLCVLTLHGSKGLEFPHVILVDLGKKNRATNSPTLFWDRTRGAYLVRKDRDGERIEDPAFDEWKAQERAKELAESKRVFYVALTRAQERLILACPTLSEKDAQFLEEKVYGEDFWRGWLKASGAMRDVPVIQGSELPQISNDPEKISTEFRVSQLPQGTFLPVRPRHSVTEWNLLSRCPRSYEWTYIRPRAPAQRSHESFTFVADDQGELSQRELGTEVHACLEKGNWERLQRLEDTVGSDRFNAERVREWAQASPDMSPGGLPELSFEVPVEGEILVGSIDRVVQTDRGLRVVDFKVTRHEKSAEDLIDAYQTQMELYRWALARLENISDPAKVETVLVNFSESAITEVPVSPNGLKPAELAKAASRIVRGEAGAPKPGKLCQVCQFSEVCDAFKTSADRY